MASAALTELGIDATAPSITGRYSVGRTLGEGRFSTVQAGTCVRTGAEVALKAMALAEVTDDKDAREMLVQEVAVLRRANGREHIVGLREVTLWVRLLGGGSGLEGHTHSTVRSPRQLCATRTRSFLAAGALDVRHALPRDGSCPRLRAL